MSAAAEGGEAGFASPPDASELAREVRAGRLRPSALVHQALALAERLEPRLHAFLALEAEGALARAAELERALDGGEELGPLAGVPLAIKANFCVEGVESSCASRLLAGWRAPYSATAVERLCAAGAIPLGPTNMDEFGMGSSSEHSAFGATRNPWDGARTPGGSSSGSAAAVAAGIAALGLGSDTGGSVRQPAAFCGLAGLKPTWGRVSRYGLIAFASSLDQPALLARSVRDLALALGVVSGADARDASALELAPTLIGLEGRPSPRGLRLGVPREWEAEGIDGAVRARVRETLERLAQAGAEIVPVGLPSTRHAIATYYVIATAEASSNLARYDGVRYGRRVEGATLDAMLAATREAGFGAEVKRRILLGTHVLSAGYRDAWYGQAQRARAALRADFERAFEEVDLIVGPTTPTPAFRLGEKLADPLAMYLADVLTVPASLAGLPAASVPCGLVEEDGTRLPVGLQLVGPALAEERVLRGAAAVEALVGRFAPPSAAEVRA